MTWEAFWWPNIAGALVSVGITTLVGVPLGFVVRRAWRQWLTTQERVAEHALQASVSATQGAQDASSVVTGQAEVVRRLKAVEGAVDGMKESTSASLGHRAREDVRFRGLEQRMAAAEQARGSR